METPRQAAAPMSWGLAAGGGGAAAAGLEGINEAVAQAVSAAAAAAAER
eukprot:COSAG01_NODE_9326_length_2483_cov_2.095638_2_plen_49_part_00